MTKTPVRLDRSGDVGLIIVDHPPVNALSRPVREGLLAALAELAADARLRAAVIACEGRTFIAGADIGEFDRELPGPAVSAVLTAIDASRKPIVAAIHGSALGGGYELALVCHARLIAPDGFVGFPEVRIGLIPGAGGTQRAPRLTGPLVALDMIASGRSVPADEAMALGLVDEVATDLRHAAIARARHLADAGLRRRARGALAPMRAVEAVEIALTAPLADGLAREQAITADLHHGPQSKALRHLFYAERRATRMPHAAPWPVRRVGVVGGGTMGSGIAVAFSDAGLDVTV